MHPENEPTERVHFARGNCGIGGESLASPGASWNEITPTALRGASRAHTHMRTVFVFSKEQVDDVNKYAGSTATIFLPVTVLQVCNGANSGNDGHGNF